MRDRAGWADPIPGDAIAAECQLDVDLVLPKLVLGNWPESFPVVRVDESDETARVGHDLHAVGHAAKGRVDLV